MSTTVQLYIYDLSGGIARSLSPSLLGQQIDGIWHTSIVLRGLEYYFGGGINVAPAGSSPFGQPIQIEILGQTYLDAETIEQLLVAISDRYSPQSYSLFEHNCNTFSNEFSQLLTGNPIPSHITELPKTVLASPFGQMIKPMLAGLEQQMKNMREYAFNPPSLEYESREAQPNSIAHETIIPEAAAEKEEEEEEEEEKKETHALPPALLLAEKEIEVAVAECAFNDMEQRREELNLKEGANTPLQQLGRQGAERLETEEEVKKVCEALLNEGVVDNIEDAEMLAVETVAEEKERMERNSVGI